MNVAIITTEDQFYVRHFFKVFMRYSPRSYTIKGVTILPAFKKSTWALMQQMWGFYGPGYFLFMGVQHVVRKLLKMTVAQEVTHGGAPLVSFASVNSPEYIAWLKENKIDLLVSVASPEIFRRELLEAVPQGCINSHSSLLPENRGMMPVFWALYKNEKELGVTIHTMTAELDRGEILMQEIVPNQGASLDAMIFATKEISARLMHSTLESFSKGTETRTTMSSGGSYQTFPTALEVKEFRRRGNRLF